VERSRTTQIGSDCRPALCCKRSYKKLLDSERRAERHCYTNDLHDALMNKSGASFWKCWKSKFNKGCGISKFIDGLTDEESTAEAFAEHFRKTCTNFNDDQNTRLQSIYQNRRQHYVGDPFLDKHKFDAEGIEVATAEMKRGKAAGLDELTTEHLVQSHPVLFAILAKLFNIIMLAGYVPYGFRLSYTVPLPKVVTVSSTNAVDNYRAISISPILSKIFERCI